MEENLNKEANAASEQSNEQANVPVVSKGRQLLDELKRKGPDKSKIGQVFVYVPFNGQLKK